MGSDIRSLYLFVSASYFNPRSPHGERPVISEYNYISSYFNPRSPHGERLLKEESLEQVKEDFNPRSPHGERLAAYGLASSTSAFQSTLPAWGATLAHLGEQAILNISIHAPRMGSDEHFFLRIHHMQNFNPRSPHGERHAMHMQELGKTNYFNPRSPHGERPARKRIANAAEQYFNPRSPHGERHFRAMRLYALASFQSTRPAWGATTGLGRIQHCRPHFNPRSPHGERPTV